MDWYDLICLPYYSSTLDSKMNRFRRQAPGKIMSHGLMFNTDKIEKCPIPPLYFCGTKVHPSIH